jgi:hypothetical protein
MRNHNCLQQGNGGEYIWLCSRCNTCYVCKHRAVFFDSEEVWKWKNKAGKFEELILDGRLNER